MDDERTIDPGMVAKLDQLCAEHNGNLDEFEDTYGFRHECTCAADYAAGRVVEGTPCGVRLTQEALGAAAEHKRTIKAWEFIAEEFSNLAEYFYAKLKKQSDSDGV